MKNTTASQKVGLVIFGFISAFLLLEAGLRVGGMIFALRQDWYNHTSIPGREKVFQILCIGESTTALGGDNAYPYQLENILNSKGLPVRFEVFNRGLVSKTSADILAELDADMKKYKPDLVIGMIGINDIKAPLPVPSSFGKWDTLGDKSRVYKLFKLIFLGLQEKICARSRPQVPAQLEHRSSPSHETSLKHQDLIVDSAQPDTHVPSMTNNVQLIEQELIRDQAASAQLKKMINQTADPKEIEKLKANLVPFEIKNGWDMVYLGSSYRQHGDFEKAHKLMLQAISQYPDNFGVYIEMGRIYKDQKDFRKAIPCFLQALNKGGQRAIYAMLELGRCYNALEDYDHAQKFYAMIFENKPKDYWIYREIGIWFKDHHYWAQAEKVFQEAIRINPQDNSSYQSLAEVYGAQGRSAEAAALNEKSHTISSDEQAYPAGTIENYNKIADLVFSHGTKLICMQYPLRSVEPLRKIMHQREKIVFVENQKNFEEALKNGQYVSYFSDNFAGDFGHCTRLGNRLIADHLAGVIVQNYFQHPKLK